MTNSALQSGDNHVPRRLGFSPESLWDKAQSTFVASVSALKDGVSQLSKESKIEIIIL